MSTSKSQKQKILSLSIKDKKLSRLFFCADLSDKDSLFLNNIYEERHSLHFKYCIGLSLFTAIIINWTAFRFVSTLTQGVVFAGVFGASHLFWTSRINIRFAQLTEPYYQKYSIK